MISKDDVKKLGELARIHLTAKEEDALAHDLENILAYVDKLKEIDVSNVPEMTHAGDVRNVFRPDEIIERDFGLIKDQFPEEERGFLKVKGVFKRE